jgi:hypothetical protein
MVARALLVISPLCTVTSASHGLCREKRNALREGALLSRRFVSCYPDRHRLWITSQELPRWGLRISRSIYARLKRRVPQVLLGSDVNAVPLPLSLFAQPNWLVPTDTDVLTVVAKGTVPIAMDVSAANGDPDVLGGSFGDASFATLIAPEIAPGFFFALPEATGPFPAGGVGRGATVNLAAVANTNPFDSAVSASSGDVWAQSVNASAPYTPLSLAPGGSGSITLTITPTGPK